jgi:hypothetical protein
MSLTSIAVILAGAWIAITSQTYVSTTASLIWGIVIVALVVLDYFGVAGPARRTRA